MSCSYALSFARRLFEQDVFPDSRWLLVPGAGHVVYLERPDLFFPTLKAFMRAKATAFEATFVSTPPV